MPLRGDTTMISGASGVGKSTVLDAYTALMMPSDTKFNGASNDAVVGRARGAGQRNLLSYLRGAVDVVDNPRTGRPEEKLLRGKGVDTWGAVAMTFVNDQGGRFTVLRTYYVPRRATRSGDVQMQLVTHDGPLALDQLEVAVAERFHAVTLKKLYPGIRVHRTYGDFAAVLHARLGIGAGETVPRRCACWRGSKPVTRCARSTSSTRTWSSSDPPPTPPPTAPSSTSMTSTRPTAPCAPRRPSSNSSLRSPNSTSARALPWPARRRWTRTASLRSETLRCGCGCCAPTCDSSNRPSPPIARRASG
ncbi:ATP-binding protein [Nocardioides alcanivorans]|uniref:ATP-binding protein n=1 Tax=Nocardioides alcanivorans TaxID=2897352 RepID=UPI001F388E68|nr:ATP-binding protein [Nocardioides alcanivorans]